MGKNFVRNVHETGALGAILAGKDVFVEKPLALTVIEGTELVELAEKTARVLMVGHILQYHPAIPEVEGDRKQRALDLNEKDPLPADLATGLKTHDELKAASSLQESLSSKFLLSIAICRYQGRSPQCRKRSPRFAGVHPRPEDSGIRRLAIGRYTQRVD